MAVESAGYPLRIGVTGHRSLSDELAVTDAVTRVLARIEETLHQVPVRGGLDRPWYSRVIDVVALTLVRPLLKLFGLPTPDGSAAATAKPQLDWTVISPLAKGADRIVARAVLAKAGAKLHVVTPLPLDEYHKDFSDGTDRQEFEELLQHDEAPTELHNEQGEGEIDWSNHEYRNQAYDDVGRHVVGACELLIAIWDGKVAAGLGGTGDIVRYAVSRRRCVLWIDASDPHRPACLIVPDKKSNEPFPGAAVVPLPWLPKQLSLGFHRLAAYNRDPIVSEVDLKQAIDREVEQLRKQASKAGLPQQSLESIEEYLLPLYARADLMAAAYQRLYLFGAKALFRLSALAVSIAVLQLLFFPVANWLIAFEVLAMLAAVALLRVGRLEAWHEKWLNDRHLAEWVRSAAFTVFLGQQHAGKCERTNLPFYESPDQWFVDAFGDLLTRASAGMPAVDLKALKQHLVTQWIAGQASWHAGNAERKKNIAHSYHRFGVTCFCLTLVMATLHMIGVGHGHGHGEYNRLGDVSLWIGFFAVILPAWGASIHAIASLLEYDRIAVRSKQMSITLGRIAERAERAKTLDDLAAEIGLAEEIMAAENHEWVVSLKFRDLVLPA